MEHPENSVKKHVFHVRILSKLSFTASAFETSADEATCKSSHIQEPLILYSISSYHCKATSFFLNLTVKKMKTNLSC